MAILAVVAWGALAFGAVYPWAYQPLLVGGAVVGLAGLILIRVNRPPIGLLAAAIAVLAIGVGVQLIPLSREQLSQVSPATIRFLTQYDFAYTVGGSSHPISIAPDKTTLGLLMLAALSVFMLGVARLISRFGAERVVLGMVWFGALLAVFGLVQEAVNITNLEILVYGFWKPVYYGSRPFGPFINRNHFAGWMLMVLPLALGFVYATIERRWRDAAGTGDTHGRVSLLAASSGGRLLLLIFACAIMFMSVLMTRSRSGIAAGAVEALLVGSVLIFKQKTMRAKVAMAAVFAMVFAATAAWAGGDAVLGRVVRSDSNMSTIGGRIPIWQDSLAIARDFKWTGSGLDTYGRAMILYQTFGRELHYQEAHNDYIQLAAEGGLLLGVPLLAVLAVFARSVRRRFKEAPKEGMTYWLRVGAVIGLVSIAAQSAVEFSLQMPGNAALFAVLAAIALHQSPNLRRRTT